MAAIVQSVSGRVTAPGDVQLASAPTAGNTVLLWKTISGTGNPAPEVQDGFTEIVGREYFGGNHAKVSLQSRVVQVGDDETITADADAAAASAVLTYAVIEVEGTLGDWVATIEGGALANPTMIAGGTLATSSGDLVIGFTGFAQASDEPGISAVAAVSPSTEVEEQLYAYGTYPNVWVGSRASSGGTIGIEATLTKGDSRSIVYSGVSIIVEGESEPPGEPGEEIPFEEPEPARALLEIYLTGIGDPARWDVALWDEDDWAEGGWVDITHLGVSVDWAWGASRADAGILADIEADQCVVVTYDPDRHLDPANAQSPYYPQITYGLPIRLSHRGLVIRTGICEIIEYSHESGFGSIRATSHIAALAGVTVPEDVTLSNNVYDRARDVIAATGLPINLGMGEGDIGPPIADWEAGEFRGWFVIAEAAREALLIPTMDRHNRLIFRSWTNPTDRGSVIGSPELIELVPAVSSSDLYSVVIVNDATAMTEVERRITPLPQYGERVYRRDLATINGGDWADAVLEDRGLSSLRWRPGAIFPLDASAVDFYTNLEIGELVTIEHPQADPVIEVRGRILGKRVRVVDLGERAGPDWRWWVQATTAGLDPLVSDEDLTIYLVSDDDNATLLYPDGVISIS